MDPDHIVFLHCLLNSHLGPPDDQLPITGSGSTDFGPRTKAKVQRFQEINRIDIGTPDFKDGVVGRHTWAKLTETQQITLSCLAAPELKLTPPTFPSYPGMFPPPSPSAIPVPKLTLDNFQVQAGEQGTFPFGGGVTVAHSLQIVAVFLNKNDKAGLHPEIQVGPTILSNRGPGADSKTDFGLLAIFNVANMPLSGGRFNWSVQAQLALMKSLTNPSGSGQLTGLLSANLGIIKDKDGNDVFQVTTQLGPLLDAAAPNRVNDRRWVVTGGAVLFFGLTGTLGVP
jgi:hypothetical protein